MCDELSAIVQAEVLAKHVSDYNIKAVKFSPYEEGRLMTCGKDSVRMFRLKVRLKANSCALHGHPVYFALALCA